nr:helix-turn-helix domain-containing protein [Formosa algae]
MQRKLRDTTIYSHIAKLHSDGKDINIYDFVSKREVEDVKKAKATIEGSTSLKAYYDYFDEQLDYFKIRLALSVIDN